MGQAELAGVIEDFYASHPWVFNNPKVLDAFKAVDRADFLPSEARGLAYENKPVLLANGQPCSQPEMVAVMANVLDLRPGLSVLMIGTGSGYTDAIFYETMERQGRLTTVEIDTELYTMGRKNLEQHFGPLEGKIEFILGDGSIGYERNTPYDRICLTASANGKTFRKRSLSSQLQRGGILMLPESRSERLLTYRKGRFGLYDKKEICIARFVRLQGRNT